MATNKNGYRDYSREIDDPIRIERRMKFAHFFGLVDLEKELWIKLQMLTKEKEDGNV